MADISKDGWLNRQLKGLRLADSFSSDETIRWGEFIKPSRDTRPQPTDETLRIAVIASLPLGFLTLKTALAYEEHFPEDVYIVCLLTDDPANADAKIGVKKRMWHLFPEEERRLIEAETVKSALAAGIPVYTGDIKRDWFREKLSGLSPDAILCSGFGQIIDPPFLKIPKLGIYNFHPSDLVHGFGAGPAPYEDSKARDAKFTCWTVHLVNEAIDDGHILGFSPPINILHADGRFPEDPKDYYSKVADGLDHLVFSTIEALTGWHRASRTEPMSGIDFGARFPHEIKQRMLEPIRDFPEYLFPDPALFTGR